MQVSSFGLVGDAKGLGTFKSTLPERHIYIISRQMDERSSDNLCAST